MEIKDNNELHDNNKRGDRFTVMGEKIQSPTHGKKKTNIKNQCFILGKTTPRAFSKELMILEKTGL